MPSSDTPGGFGDNEAFDDILQTKINLPKSNVEQFLYSA